MIPPHLEFQRLKRAVSIESLLQHRGLLRDMRHRGNRLIGPCPVHHGTNPNAFVVDRQKDLWYCFSGCSAGGDVVELVRRLDGSDYHETAQSLCRIVGNTMAITRPQTRPHRSQASDFRPYARQLRLHHDHPLLQNKGIRPDTARRFEAGGWTGRGFLEGCVGVRLHDPKGLPLGYAGRRLDPEKARLCGKWKFPTRLPKRQLLFNIHRIVNDLHNSLVVVVECPWGVMRLEQLGLFAVALMGTHLFPEAVRLLAPAPRVALLLDGDTVGRKAAVKIRETLEGQNDVQTLCLPDGADPDDLSNRELFDLLMPSFLF